MVPASSSSRSLVFEKDLPLLFLLPRLFRFLLGGILRLRFFCFFLRRGFLLRCFLGRLLRRRLWRRLCRGRLFLGLPPDHHHLFFLSFSHPFPFPSQPLPS